MSTAPVGNNVNPLSWLSVLNEVNGTTNAAEAQQVSETNRSVTFTATVNGVETKVTMKVPDDLELPAEVTPEAIDELMAKLVGGDFNLTQTQLLAIKSSITKTYTQMASALASVQSGSTGRVMCDLYQLMALLVEVAQSQRNAARDLRNSQNQQIQNSIQAQADSQRNAAIVGLAVGVTCGVISAVVSVGMLAGQSAAYKGQVNAARSSGMEAAQSKVTMLQNADTPEHAQAQLNKIAGERGMNGVQERIANEIQQNESVAKAHSDFEIAKGVKAAETELAAAKTPEAQSQLETAKQELQTARTEQDQARNDVNGAVENDEFKITEDRTAAQAKDAYHAACEQEGMEPDPLLDAKYNRAIAAENRVATAKNAVDTHPITVAQARFDELSAAAAQAGVPGFDDARANYRAALDNAADGYALKYENAVAQKAPKAEIAAAKNNMRMARAYVNNEMMRDPSVRTTPVEYKEAMGKAKFGMDAASKRLDSNLDYKGALRRIETLGGINAINTAIGNMLQSMTQSISGSINSEATRMGAEQQKEQEQLDQTKDLFNQAQSVVDAAVQLMNAVRQAETQSMRDAIQA